MITSAYPAKIWPMVGLSAVNRGHGNAWRVWVIARYLDIEGAGKISKADLFEALKGLGVGERKRRRWFSAALKLGIIREPKHKGIVYLAGLGRATLALGAESIGRPALIPVSKLLTKGWRAVVWGAYLQTLNGRPASQNKKAELTGIDPRTQRNYQAAIPVTKRKNYCETKFKPSQMPGLREVRGRAYFANHQGKVFQRLPDIVMANSVAATCKKGRSRKAQSVVNNLSSFVGREPGTTPRLFHESPKGCKSAIRHWVIGKGGPKADAPEDMFVLKHAGQTNNLWEVAQVWTF